MNQGRYKNLTKDEALLLYSIFALSARFSNSEYFFGVPIYERGRPYSTEALSIIQQHVLVEVDHDVPSITTAQGVVLSAFFWLSRGPNLQAWILTGTACRIAHLLGLSSVDEDIFNDPSRHYMLLSSEWAAREGLRRLWWAIFQLDNIGAGMSSRPQKLDRHNLHVLLPVSDQSWFSAAPIPSSFLERDPMSTWRSLVASQNRNAHAWYIVATHFVITTHEMAQQRPIQPESFRSMDTAISCFDMGMPDEFDLENGAINWTEGHVAQCNWIIALHLMLQCARSNLIHMETYCEDLRAALRSGSGSPVLEVQSKGCYASSQRALSRSRPLLVRVMRAVKAWSPEHVPLCSPFTVILLMGQYSSWVRCTSGLEDQNLEAMKELLALTIARIANYWTIGCLVLGTCSPESRYSLADWLTRVLQHPSWSKSADRSGKGIVYHVHGTIRDAATATRSGRERAVSELDYIELCMYSGLSSNSNE